VIDYSLAANTGKAAFVRANFGSDPQVRYVYVYANTRGSGSVWYRIGTATFDGEVIEDNLADNSVNTGTVGPSAGQYDVPLEASCICIHKNRVFLNSVDQPQTLQVNNLLAPTQWASIYTGATDGTRLTIQTHQADPIVALVPLGSLLTIFKGSRIVQLWGDTPAQFRVVEIHARGMNSPDSVARCDNVVVVLLDDGVYAAGFNEGFMLNKLSGSLQTTFDDLRRTATGREQLARASATFAQSRYFLEIGNVVYCYDFDNGEWSSYAA
jgi:hypothetical protein